MSNIEDLRKEATELGIKFQANIGAERLQGKIDEYYESQETSEKEIIAVVEANEQSEEKSAESDKPVKLTTKQRMAIKAAKARAAAEKTRVVTLIDNDQRVNNQTSTCTVNCSNEYFDLGTIKLPLNLEVEVRKGHLDVLKELEIPQHILDPKTKLSTTRMVPRYTIAYSDKKVD